MNTVARVAINKRKRPEYYCPVPRCLWRTLVCDPVTRQMRPAANCLDGFCPRHKRNEPQPTSTALDWIRNGFQFPGKPVPSDEGGA